ncbi:MAG: hypothetical protein HC913_18955 [Microscillaceae bacterium]|nr:hypothetical protein [Microscillaceae bacterium]
MVTRIVTLVLLIGAISLGYMLYSNVKGPVDEKVSIQRTEKQIERKLKYVRDVQALYLVQNGKYAGKWKDLEDFVLNGSILNVQQREVTKLQDDGKETITIEYDTLGTIPVKDSLAGQYADVDPRKMSIIPVTGKQFTLFAGKVDNGGRDAQCL